MKYDYAEVRWLPATITHGEGYFVRLLNARTGRWEIVGDAHSTLKAAERALNRVVLLLRSGKDCFKEDYNNA